MSERSLPPFGHADPLPRRKPRNAARRALGNAFGSLFENTIGKLFGLFGRRRKVAGAVPADTTPVDAGLASRAEAEISAHLAAHAALFERAARLTEKAVRLDTAGTPSDSARNRAERAVEEAKASLHNPRVAFEATHGEAGRRAFDAEAARRLPYL